MPVTEVQINRHTKRKLMATRGEELVLRYNIIVHVEMLYRFGLLTHWSI